MTSLANASNVFARTGPMSVATPPEEYGRRFLEMIDDISDVVEN